MNTKTKSLTTEEEEEITQLAQRAAACNKRMLALINPIDGSDPRLREAMQVFLRTYANEFDVTESRANALFAHVQACVSVDLTGKAGVSWGVGPRPAQAGQGRP
jgi:uncharacterized protein involved in exopolysaccharide biosynthesis